MIRDTWALIIIPTRTGRRSSPIFSSIRNSFERRNPRIAYTEGVRKETVGHSRWKSYDSGWRARVWLPQQKILSTNWSTTRQAIEGSPILSLSFSLLRNDVLVLIQHISPSFDLLTRSDSYLITISPLLFPWIMGLREDIWRRLHQWRLHAGAGLSFPAPFSFFFFPLSSSLLLVFSSASTDGGYRRLPTRSYRLIRESSKVSDDFNGKETILCTV